MSSDTPKSGDTVSRFLAQAILELADAAQDASRVYPDQRAQDARTLARQAFPDLESRRERIGRLVWEADEEDEKKGRTRAR